MQPANIYSHMLFLSDAHYSILHKCSPKWFHLGLHWYRDKGSRNNCAWGTATGSTHHSYRLSTVYTATPSATGSTHHSYRLSTAQLQAQYTTATGSVQHSYRLSTAQLQALHTTATGSVQHNVTRHTGSKTWHATCIYILKNILIGCLHIGDSHVLLMTTCTNIHTYPDCWPIA